MDTITVGLVSGRHEMPVKGYIFEKIDDIFSYDEMRKAINNFLALEVGITTKTGCGINQADNVDVEVFVGTKPLVVYVTGLTAATAELISCCAANGVHLTLMHYNTATGEYVPQVVL